MKKVLNDTPTKVLIWLLLVFITVFSLTSCSDGRSGHFLDGTAKFRVKQATYYLGEFTPSQLVEIRTLDTNYRVGDTIKIEGDYLILYERLK